MTLLFNLVSIDVIMNLINLFNNIPQSPHYFSHPYLNKNLPYDEKG